MEKYWPKVKVIVPIRSLNEIRLKFNEHGLSCCQQLNFWNNFGLSFQIIRGSSDNSWLRVINLTIWTSSRLTFWFTTQGYHLENLDWLTINIFIHSSRLSFRRFGLAHGSHFDFQLRVLIISISSSGFLSFRFAA